MALPSSIYASQSKRQRMQSLIIYSFLEMTEDKQASKMCVGVVVDGLLEKGSLDERNWKNLGKR